MARNRRQHYSNTIYHVMLRGNYRQNIFFQESDYQLFSDIVEEAALKYHIKVHLFCYMTNHIHLVAQVRDIPLGKFIQRVSCRFSRIQNIKIARTGHLFQGRYLDKIVKDEDYLLALCFYIHMNPVKAAMASHPDGYHWSSHHVYIGSNKTAWVFTRVVSSLIAKRYGGYQNFMDEMAISGIPEKMRKLLAFENLDIVEQDNFQEIEHMLTRISSYQASLDEIVQIVCDYLGCSERHIVRNTRDFKTKFAQASVIYLAFYCSNFRLSDLGQRMGVCQRTVQRRLDWLSVQRRGCRRVDEEVVDLIYQVYRLPQKQDFYISGS